MTDCEMWLSGWPFLAHNRSAADTRQPGASVSGARCRLALTRNDITIEFRSARHRAQTSRTALHILSAFRPNTRVPLYLYPTTCRTIHT